MLRRVARLEIEGRRERSPFEGQKEALAVDATAVAGEAAIAPDHTVARHHDGQGVATVRLTHRTHCVRPTDGARDVAVARGRTVRNRAQRFPHRELERRSLWLEL